MNLDPFERRMIGHALNNQPSMTLKGTIITIALITTLVYVVIDCGIF